MGIKSITRSLATLTFALLFMLAALARPALAQSEGDLQVRTVSSKEFHSSSSKVMLGADFGPVIVGTTSAPVSVALTNTYRKNYQDQEHHSHPPFHRDERHL